MTLPTHLPLGQTRNLPYFMFFIYFRAPDDGNLVAVGRILNKNTVEGFTEVDKAKFLADEGAELIKAIKGEALDNPQLLARFSILCFADLKKHQFTYWFAFPALNVVTCRFNLAPYYAEEMFSSEELDKLALIDKKRNYFVLNAAKTEFKIYYDLREGFAAMKKPSDWFLVCADSTDNDSNPGWPLRNYLALFAYHW